MIPSHLELGSHMKLPHKQKSRLVSRTFQALRIALTLTVFGAAVACGGDEQTAPATVVQEAAIYVSAVSGDDTRNGKTPLEAVATIGVGIERAKSCSTQACPVKIAAGKYEEKVELVAGVHLLGGYGPTFQERDGAIHVVTVSSTEDTTLVAKGIDVPTRVESLRIVAADLRERQDGASSVGLWVADTQKQLELIDVVVQGGFGANAADGLDGQEKSCDARGGSGGEAFDCGGSKGAEGDAGGDGVTGGDGGEPGSSNCPNACPLVGSDGVSDGKEGKPGANGIDGMEGEASSDVHGRFVDGAWLGKEGSPGQRGFNGTGGGGGGSGGSKRFKACFGCGTLVGGRGGEGAPGGCGGGGGGSGGVGGASFGIVLLNSTLIIRGGEVLGGVGGVGGRGGQGLGGQTGGNDTGVNQSGSKKQKCGLINYSSGAGAKGGIGGRGGNGGSGAGGNGGPSVAIALVGNSEVSPSSIFQVEPGEGGAGGPGGSATGAAGSSGASEKTFSFESSQSSD